MSLLREPEISGPYGPWPGNKRPVALGQVGILGSVPPQALEAASIGASLPYGLLNVGQEKSTPLAGPFDPYERRKYYANRTVHDVMRDTFGFDPNMERGAILPLGRQAGSESTEFAAPQWLYDMVASSILPGHAAQGGQYSPEDVVNMAMSVTGGSSLADAPAGSLAAGAARRKGQTILGENIDRLAATMRTSGKKLRHYKEARPDLPDDDLRAIQSRRREIDALREQRWSNRRVEEDDPLVRAKALRSRRTPTARRVEAEKNAARRAEERAKEAAREGARQERRDLANTSPVSLSWTKAEMKRVQDQVWDQDNFEREMASATLNALARGAKKRGWKLRHVSKSRGDNRVSSRYVQIPGKGEIRISDHEIPWTPARSGGRTRWDREYIVQNYMDEMSVDEMLDMMAKDLSGN